MQAQGEDDGTAQLDVPYFITSREGLRPMGVYSLYSSNGELQYVGFSRNMVVAIKVRLGIMRLCWWTLGLYALYPHSSALLSSAQAHLSRVGPQLCASVRPMVFANKAMATRAALVKQAQNWIEEAGMEPPGNGSKRGLWEARHSDRSLLLVSFGNQAQ